MTTYDEIKLVATIAGNLVAAQLVATEQSYRLSDFSQFTEEVAAAHEIVKAAENKVNGK